MKRTILHLTYSKKTQVWLVKEGATLLCSFDRKDGGLEWAAKYCKGLWTRCLRKAQLVVHKQDGTIAFERTYGKDPRRSKG